MKNRKLQIIRTLAVVIASTVACISTSSSLTAQTGNGQIYNSLSDKCLQPVNKSTAQGAAIVLEPCNGSPAQHWKKISVKGNMSHYENLLSKMCLDARGGAANHTPVQQWTCNKITNENWQSATDTGDTMATLLSRVSGTNSFCLDIPGGQTTPGIAVQIYGCNGTAAQKWVTP